MIKAEEIPTKEAEEIINKVITIYARGNIDRYIWERVTNEVAINHKDAWQWINTFISNSEAIMFLILLMRKKRIDYQMGMMLLLYLVKHMDSNFI